MNYPPPPPPPPASNDTAPYIALANEIMYPTAQAGEITEPVTFPPPPPMDHIEERYSRLAAGESIGSVINNAHAQPLPAPPSSPVSLPPPVPAAPVAKPRVNSQNKGKRGEREVVKLLQAIVDKVRRDRGLPELVIQRNTLQAHMGGEDLHGLDGFAVEVKWQEEPSVPAWWRQAVEQANRRNAVPILFYRASRQPWAVKFRAYVNTPGDRDQIEMDITTTAEDFVEWFGNAYDESLSA